MVCVLWVKVRAEQLLFLLLAYSICDRGPSQLIQTVKMIYRGFGPLTFGPNSRVMHASTDRQGIYPMNTISDYPAKRTYFEPRMLET
jgi:hypothetical protein